MRSRPTAEPPGRRHPVKPFGETGPGGKSPAQIPVCRILYCNPVCTGTRAGVFFGADGETRGLLRTVAKTPGKAARRGRNGSAPRAFFCVRARLQWQRIGVGCRQRNASGVPSPPEEGPGLPFLRPGKSLTPRTGGRRERRGGRQRRGEARASGAVRAREPPRLRRRGNTAYRTRAVRGQRRA